MRKFLFYSLSFILVGIIVLVANGTVGHGDVVQLDSELAENVNEIYSNLSNEDVAELANQVVNVSVEYNEEIESSNLQESFDEWKTISMRLVSEGTAEELTDLFEKKTKSIYNEVNG